MSRYQKQVAVSGVMGEVVTIIDTETGNMFQDFEGSQNVHHMQYLEWLAEGNEPELVTL